MSPLLDKLYQLGYFKLSEETEVNTLTGKRAVKIKYIKIYLDFIIMIEVSNGTICSSGVAPKYYDNFKFYLQKHIDRCQEAFNILTKDLKEVNKYVNK